MTENQIKIKLVLDTSDSGKIKAELDKTLDVQKDINAYTQKQTELTRQVAARYNEVYEKINQIAGKAKSFAQAETRVKPVLVGFNQFKAEAEAKLQAFAAELQNLNIPAAKLGNLEATAKQLQVEKQIVAEQALQYQSYIKLRNETAVRNTQELANLRTLEQQTAEARKLSEAYARANLSIGPSLGRQTSNNVPGGFATLGGASPQATKVNASFAALGNNIYRPPGANGIDIATRMSLAYRQQQEAILENQRRQNNNTQESIKRHRGLVLSIAEAVGIYRVLTSLMNTAINAIKAVPKIGIEMESTIASLSSTLGSEAKAAGALLALNKEAERTGITIDALRTSFRTFQASTSLAGESLESTWKMFTNINTVSSALHLTTEKTNLVFLALAQIFNKSKVQSEELVKQLGNLLPGAFASFAAANKDLFANTQDLVTKMKLGVVTAHGTVEKFTEYLSNRFETAFNLASKGLNANVGRMQTSFTLLGESIYNTTKGPMLSFVKGVTDIVNYLKEGVDGTNNLGEVLKQLGVIIEGALIAKIALSVKELIALKGAAIAASFSMKGLQAAMAFLAGPTAIITGISLIIAKLSSLREETNDARASIADFFADYQKQTKALSKAEKIKFEVEAAPAVKAAKDVLETINNEIAKTESNSKALQLKQKLGLTSEEDKRALADLRYNYAARAQAEEILAEQRATALLEIQTKQDVENLQQIDAYATKRRQLEIAAERSRGNDVAAARLQAEETYSSVVADARKKIEELSSTPINLLDPKAKEELENSKKVIEDFNALLENAGSKTAAKSAKASKAKEFVAELKQIGLTAEQQRTFISEDLAALNEDYASSLVSIKDYYAKRTELETRYYDLAKQGFKEQAEAALRSGDRNKALEASTKLERIAQEESRKLSQTKIEETKAYIDLANAISGVNSEYLKAQGKSGDASLAEFQTKYAELRKRLATDSSPSAQQAQQQLNELEGWTAAISKSQDAVTGYELAKSNLAIQEERIQNSLRSGAITELDSLSRLQDARREAVKQMEEYVKVRENALTNVPRDNPEVIRLQQIRNELENLKLETNLFATKFGTVFTQNFSNAFSAFATGAMTAKEAFASFAQGVIKNLAEIAAQEASQQILKLVVGSISSISGSFGGGLSDGINLSNSSISYASIGRAAGFANGGIASGLGFGNGTILDKPTYFPNARPTMFASGGVVAGEAGAEAVLPLRRGKDGKLGVVMQNEGSTQGSNVYNINVVVEKAKNESSEDTGNKIAIAMMKKIAQSEIANANRPGNQSNKITTFG